MNYSSASKRSIALGPFKKISSKLEELNPLCGINSVMVFNYIFSV